MKQVLRMSLLTTVLVAICSCFKFEAIKRPKKLPDGADPITSFLNNLFPQAVETHTCEVLDGRPELKGRQLRVCFTTTEGSTSNDVLFVLPGTGMDWSVYAIMTEFREHWLEMGNTPVAITLDFGSAWFLNNPNGAKDSGLWPIFKDIVPFLKQRASQLNNNIPVTGKTLGVGFSQGGANIIKILDLTLHEEKTAPFFDRWAALCPAMFMLPPYSSEAEIAAYIQNHKAWDVFVNLVALPAFRASFPSNEAYKAWAPVFHPEIFDDVPPGLITWTTDDLAGVHIGAMEFYKKAKSVGANIIHHEFQGGQHCVPTPQKLAAEFLANKPGYEALATPDAAPQATQAASVTPGQVP